MRIIDNAILPFFASTRNQQLPNKFQQGRMGLGKKLQPFSAGVFLMVMYF
jgi:hypothetical protein